MVVVNSFGGKGKVLTPEISQLENVGNPRLRSPSFQTGEDECVRQEISTHRKLMQPEVEEKGEVSSWMI